MAQNLSPCFKHFEKELDENLEKLLSVFNTISKNWNTYKKKQKVRDFIF